MTIIFDPPPWAFEPCRGWGRALPLTAHELTCPCFDSRTRIAVAWICNHCDLVVDIVGLFTSWSAAITGRQDELDARAARYLNPTSGSQPGPRWRWRPNHRVEAGVQQCRGVVEAGPGFRQRADIDDATARFQPLDDVQLVAEAVVVHRDQVDTMLGELGQRHAARTSGD